MPANACPQRGHGGAVMAPELIVSRGKTIVVWQMDAEAFEFLESIVPSSDGFARDLWSIRKRLDEKEPRHD